MSRIFELERCLRTMIGKKVLNAQIVNDERDRQEIVLTTFDGETVHILAESVNGEAELFGSSSELDKCPTLGCSFGGNFADVTTGK